MLRPGEFVRRTGFDSARRLVDSPPERPSPMTEAMEWVSRILAAAVMMFLPGLAGQWLDKRLGTGFLGPVGLAIGVVSGFAYLLAVTKTPPKAKR